MFIKIDVNTDLVMIISKILPEHRRKWKKDFSKFKNEVQGVEPSEQQTDEETQHSYAFE